MSLAKVSTVTARAWIVTVRGRCFKLRAHDGIQVGGEGKVQIDCLRWMHWHLECLPLALADARAAASAIMPRPSPPQALAAPTVAVELWGPGVLTESSDSDSESASDLDRMIMKPPPILTQSLLHRPGTSSSLAGLSQAVPGPAVKPGSLNAQGM